MSFILQIYRDHQDIISNNNITNIIKSQEFFNNIECLARILCPAKEAVKAVEYKLGARGLRSICEGILTDAMFELPSSKETNFVLDLDYARRKFDKSKLSLLKVA